MWSAVNCILPESYVHAGYQHIRLIAWSKSEIIINTASSLMSITPCKQADVWIWHKFSVNKNEIKKGVSVPSAIFYNAHSALGVWLTISQTYLGYTGASLKIFFENPEGSWHCNSPSALFDNVEPFKFFLFTLRITVCVIITMMLDENSVHIQ